MKSSGPISTAHIICQLLFILTFSGQTAFAQINESIFNRRDEYLKIHRSRFALLPHRSSFFLPFVYNWMPHNDIYERIESIEDSSKQGDLYKNSEAEFQFSFAIPIIRDMNKRDWDLMVAYTHHAWWQVYNSEWSRPFRETNYMPEIFSRYVYSTPKKALGFQLAMVDFGYVHHSNGQIQLLSRSWDRIFARALFVHKHFDSILTGWYRIPERSDEDDNPDIYNFMGVGELELVKQFGNHKFYYKTPLFALHPSHDFKYSYPLQPGIRWFLSFQSGYGHSLIEYDRKTQRLGLGLALENFVF